MIRLLAVLCLLATTAAASPLTGEAGRVIDGDTFYLTDFAGCPPYAIGRAGCKIRVHGADTPERGEPGYHAATRYLRALIAGRRLTCDVIGRSYDRAVARCYVADGDLACLLIASGHARRTHHAGRRYGGCER